MTHVPTGLDAEAEWQLVKRCVAGDVSAREALILAHAPMVRAMARRLTWSRSQGEDLVQEGYLGLLKAAERFDPSRGARFSTYARYWVRYHLQKFTRANRRIVSLPRTRNMVKARNGVRGTIRELEQARGGPVDDATIAKALGVDVDDVAHVRMEHAAADLSVDSPTNDIQLEGSLPSPEHALEDRRAQSLCEELVRQLLAQLDPRERLILEKHVLSDEGVSLREIGADLGISAERVRQLERRALTRMHERLTA
jgi:RNA polymerase sigma-32 factor